MNALRIAHPEVLVVPVNAHVLLTQRSLHVKCLIIHINYLDEMSIVAVGILSVRNPF